MNIWLVLKHSLKNGYVIKMIFDYSIVYYQNLYLKTDILLLADVFEKFRNMCLKCYKLDSCHYFSSIGLS